MKKHIITLLAVFLLVASMAGCSGAVNSIQKAGKGMSASDYVLVTYSGGEVVRWYYIDNKIVSSEDGTDGWYFIQNGQLVRVSGDAIIEEVKGKGIEKIKNEFNLTDDTRGGAQ